MALRPRSSPAAPFPGPEPLAHRVRALAARAAGHRRLAAALLAGAAVVAAVQAMTPAGAAPAGGAGAEQAGATGSSRAGLLLDHLANDGAGGVTPPAGRTAVTVRLADPAGLLLAAPGRHVDVLAGSLPPGGAPSEQAPKAGGELVAADAVVLAVPEPPVPAGDEAAGAGSGGGLAGALGGSPAGGGAGGGAGAGPLSGVVVLAVRPADVRGLAAGAGTLAFSLALPLGPAR